MIAYYAAPAGIGEGCQRWPINLSHLKAAELIELAAALATVTQVTGRTIG